MFRNIYFKCRQFFQHHYYISYTFMFLLTTGLVFQWFFRIGKTFIWQPDGMDQHFRALLYYGQWLRTVAKTILIDHSLSIPTYSFSIGYGSDIINTLHYYVIGDPFALGSAFVPVNWMVNYYCGMILLRLYFAGITFSSFCFYIGKRESKKGVSKFGILIGALVYVFCGYALLSAIRHPYFTNPLIYFPMILLGIEKIIDGKKPELFIFSVFLSAISNFYFLYMLAIITMMYVLLRLFSIYRSSQWKEMLSLLMKLSIFAILGVSMSAGILIPVIRALLHSSRMESNYSLELLYGLGAYEKIPGMFIAPSIVSSHWTTLGFASLGLLAIMVLFIQKGHRSIKIAFCIMGFMAMIPFIGKIMNGFSYPSNRWMWAMAFLVAYVVAMKWSDLLSLNIKHKILLVLLMIIYTVICRSYIRSYTPNTFFALVIGYITCFFLVFIPKRFQRTISSPLILICLLINLCGNSYYQYSASSYINDFVSYNNIDDKLNKTESTAVALTAGDDTDFYRYQAMKNNNNCTMYTGQHSVQYYWSLENGNISKYRDEMAFCGSVMAQAYGSNDSRAVSLTLANVKYSVQNNLIPYGFEKRGSFYDYTVWENKYTLPFGYTYTSAIDDEEYQKYNALEKQEAMLDACVLKKTSSKSISPSFTYTNPQYTVNVGDNVSIEGDVLRVLKSNSEITLTFEGQPDSETYLWISDFDVKDIYPKDRYTKKQWDKFSESQKESIENEQKYYKKLLQAIINCKVENVDGEEYKRKITYSTPRFTWYANRNDFLLNLGYDKKAKKSITLTFKNPGEYYWGDVQVFCQNRDNYSNQIEALKQDSLFNVDFHDNNNSFSTNTVNGSIQLDESKYLLLTIPYDEGWSATVDGKKQELLQANTMYMALELDAGEHEIHLTYRTPGLFIGLIISILSIILFTIGIIKRNLSP